MKSPFTHDIFLFIGILLSIGAFLFHIIAASHHKDDKEGEALNGWSIFSSGPYTEKGNHYRKRALAFYVPALIMWGLWYIAGKTI